MRSLLTRLFSLFLMATGSSVVMAGGADDGRRADAFAFTAIDGAPMPLSAFKGRVLLVVNTASMCGFTPQYKALQAMHERYEARGLTVIGVPANDFGGQEPKGEKDIKSFCEGAFGVTFPLAAKSVVTGPSAHPFYKWAADTLGSKSAPRWNFHKYLIGRDGRLIASFATQVEPDAPEVVKAVEAALAAQS